MTPQEKLIRAREACAAIIPEPSKYAAEIRNGECDDHSMIQACVRALNDLDKPIPDPDEAWRPFLEAMAERPGTPLGGWEHAHIARIKAARHLMPPETDHDQ